MENSSKCQDFISMVIFQKIQEAIFPNVTPGSCFQPYQEVMFENPPMDFFTNIISGHEISKFYSWKIFKTVRTSHVQKVFMEHFQIAASKFSISANKFSISPSWKIAKNIRK